MATTDEERPGTGQCYVCLDVTEETSPCVCGMPLHKKCLDTLMIKMPSATCTVCKSRIAGVPSEDTNDDTLYEDGCYVQTVITGAILLHIFVMYVLLGWGGKLALIFFGHKIKRFFSFWTITHLVAAALMSLIACKCEGVGASPLQGWDNLVRC